MLLFSTDVQQLLVVKEEVLSEQQVWIPSLDQVHPEPPHIKEAQDDQENSEPPHVKEDNEDPELHIKEEQEEQEEQEDQENSEPLHIKEEQEELWTSQEGEQLQLLEDAGSSHLARREGDCRLSRLRGILQVPWDAIQSRGQKDAEEDGVMTSCGYANPPMAQPMSE
ncbi:hypothetical protein EYF80_055388 [Liparis tanakae]|uniref:Uncharacterized protein n=1 Tax=Liparis tanakae TaxID=230148 RepID=A0A4Z2F109_9TELE|nr:hypothetical protein EYF80_055388 [Liparis tanakae]